MFFADDSIIFTHASVQEASTIEGILREYEALSGQNVNMEKCEISFSHKLDRGICHSVISALGFVEVKMHGKYLGLPTVFDKSKRISFSVIRDRVWRKLQGWKEKLLSRAGKEVLIKAVIQAIPSYAMSYFRLPVGLCHDIRSLIRQFWWGASKGKRGICWKAWDHLCHPKAEGNLGFRDFEIFNLAMLAKQFWRLHLFPNSLLARSLKARYFPKCDIWEASVGNYPSYGWRSIWGSRKLLDGGVRWKIGNNSRIRVWRDAGMPGSGSGRVITPCPEAKKDLTLASFIDPIKHELKSRDVNSCFLSFQARKIPSIPLKMDNSKDEMCWVYSKDGVLRVRDVYGMALKSGDWASCSFGPDPI